MTYPAEVTDAICVRIADGESLREICRDEKMPSKRTVLRWLADDAGFRAQYALAREAQADHYADEILEIADDATNDWMLRNAGEETVTVADHEHISRSKLRVDSRKWLMSKLAPKKYGDRVAMDLDGKLHLSHENWLERLGNQSAPPPEDQSGTVRGELPADQDQGGGSSPAPVQSSAEVHPRSAGEPES